MYNFNPILELEVTFVANLNLIQNCFNFITFNANLCRLIVK